MKNISKLSLVLMVSLGVAGVAKGQEVLKLAVMLDALMESIPGLPAQVTESFNKLKALSAENTELEKKLKATTGEPRFMLMIERLSKQGAFNEEFINFFKELNAGILKHVLYGLQKIPKLKDSLILPEVKDATGKPMPMSNAIAGLITAASSSNAKFLSVVESIESYASPKGGGAAAASEEASAF